MSVPKKLKVKHMVLEGNHGAIGHNSNLSLLVHEAHDSLEMGQRHCPANLFETMKSTHYEEFDNGIFIHLVLYADGETISIVPKSEQGMYKTYLEEEAPPETGDFLKKECFLYLFGDYALFLNSGLSDSQVKSYLTHVLRDTKAIEKNQNINVSDIANSDTVERIRRYGVKEICLKTKIDMGTWYATKPDSQNLTFPERLSSSITKLIRKDIELTEEEINNYEYTLRINNKGVLDAIHNDPLINPAIDIFMEGEADEEIFYEIILNDGGGSIKQHTLKLEKSIKIERKGSSLDISNVKEEILAYKRELNDKGLLNA